MAEDINSSDPIGLADIIRPWPVAQSLASHVAAGDLISLARCSSELRASLHGFGLAEPLPHQNDDNHIRDSINVGMHGTPYWQLLKDTAQQKCSSKTHTKGEKVHSCRLCSTLICEACIVRSSFSRGKEDTFKNRCRFFCEDCWASDNSSRSRRYPLHPAEQRLSWNSDTQHESHDDAFCNCTLKENGWLCLECKDKQNYEAVSNDRFRCYGQGCSNSVGPDHEKRRICLWCDKTLPRHLGVSRQAWNQKIIEARTRNALSRQADLEEYNRKRLKLMRMSRREMRGDASVQHDPEADKAQFVRHLDSCCNYRNYMSEASVPDGNAVFNSKRGYWTYSMAFLMEIGDRCKSSKQLQRNPTVTLATWPGTSVFARTNRQKTRERDYLTRYGSRYEGHIHSVCGKRIEPPLADDRVRQWVTLKTRILDMAFIQQLEFFQIQATLQLVYALDLPWNEFTSMLNVWFLTPLWENTEIDREPKWKNTTKKLAKTLSPSKWDLKNATDVERQIEHHAARIIERLVLAGYVLPLRTPPTASDDASHWHDSPADNRTDHIPQAHQCPLPEESSDEDYDDMKSEKAVLAQLAARLKTSLKRVKHARRTKRPDLVQAALDEVAGHQAQLDQLRPGCTATAPPAVLADAGTATADNAARLDGLSPQLGDSSRPISYDEAQRQKMRETARSSCSSTSDDVFAGDQDDDDEDEDDASFKSLDSDTAAPEAGASRDDRLGSGGAVDSQDSEWEIVPGSRNSP
jgi:hypothetical protein